MSKLNVTAEPGTYEIVITREFNAPREKVWKAFTDPALVPKWWGFSNTVVDQMEVRMGGVWRYVERTEQGEFAFRGVYHQVSAPERLVYTFEWEGMPGHILLETITLEDRDGKTIMTDSSVYQSVADRDGMLETGMEEGATISMDRLEALLETL